MLVPSLIGVGDGKKQIFGRRRAGLMMQPDFSLILVGPSHRSCEVSKGYLEKCLFLALSCHICAEACSESHFSFDLVHCDPGYLKVSTIDQECRPGAFMIAKERD